MEKFGGKINYQKLLMEGIRSTLPKHYRHSHVTLDIHFTNDYTGQFTLIIKDNRFSGEFVLTDDDVPVFKFVIGNEGIIFEVEYNKVQEVVDKIAKTY
ncbi:hypothetical protein [Mucilaginibacter ginkgonis]|uniref:Uncharacterized protein n=1 Tax=Mucilaginibacter ginkgonis TaxID=2682091 RepID=A0A6I4HZH6_9SPHI|nr:hypothetical protein [Mucilaginibacter ginkgonis]QQL50142.1 hypothetical protein GO620_001440 [Mucilaginibacter ginkgonis]